MSVKHWMTNDVITVKADTSLLKCRSLMKEKNIRRVPVVDDDNHVIGIISDRDVKGASPSKATALEVHEMQYLLAEIKAKDIMTPSPVTVKPDTTVENAAVLMVDRKIGGLPVVNDDGRLVGIITDQDIFKVLIDITGARLGGLYVALEVDDKPGAMRPVFDTLREQGARISSVLSRNPETGGKRQVFIRTMPMENGTAQEAATIDALRSVAKVLDFSHCDPVK
ncbi:CBS and ACT domain-containing protein [uncultured Desulfovibrio sp.]|uniref:CBS and ACT domain-containing protein n=1 Tax=uncultured Desulfovibrio sp. TaxID=167968 RepID=UPI00261484DD|nr:CBS and ACT domain-containing protein [uncultured Desulfovibrio sp.]